MLKKDITYEDFDGNMVTDQFRFSFSKLELLELDLEYGGLEETIERLSSTKDTKEVWKIFKELILNAVGEVAEDKRHFIKTPEIKENFANSPALSELIIEFLSNPSAGAAFIEGTLPSRLIAEVKAAQEAQAAKDSQSPSTEVSTVELPTAEPILLAESESEKPKREKLFEEYPREELVKMPQDEYDRLVPKDPKKQSREQLMISYERRATQ